MTVIEPYHVPAIDPSGFIRHLFILQLIISTDSQRNRIRLLKIPFPQKPFDPDC